MCAFGAAARRREARHPGTLAGLRRIQLGQQDKVAGVAELADGIVQERPYFPPLDFTLHLTELTIAIQQAGTSSQSYMTTTSFQPLQPRQAALRPAHNPQAVLPALLNRATSGMLDRAHRH